MSNIIILRLLCLFYFYLSITLSVSSQNIGIKGCIKNHYSNKTMSGVQVLLQPGNYNCITDEEGCFYFSSLQNGKYEIQLFLVGYSGQNHTVYLMDEIKEINFTLKPLEKEISVVEVKSQRNDNFGIARLKSVEGLAIYASKKNELIFLEDMLANKALNNGRQIFAKVAGLNIWESGDGGIQLGIGGRGLSPKRTTNFNTRQNGYDISADALGYPESYYTPCLESMERIEIIRGAASLQYGTQFGGLLNFVMKKGESDRPFVFESKQTIGSFGLWNSYNRVGGTIRGWQYFISYQYKGANGWRPNGAYELHNIYSSIYYNFNDNSSIGLEYTKYFYDSQQPGGLTDMLFNQDASQSIRQRNWFSIDWNLFALKFNHEFANGDKIDSRFFALEADRKSVGFLGMISRTDQLEDRDLIIGDYMNFGNESRWMQKYNLGNMMGTFLLGTRFYKGQTQNRQGLGDDGYDANYDFLNPNDLEGSDYLFPSYNFSVFLENYLSVNDKWSITPGIRFENIYAGSQGYYKLRHKDLAGNIIFEQNFVDTTERKRSLLLAGVGISYKLKGIEAYANISQNYRAINFTDLRVTNPNLEVDTNIMDERGFNADFGIRGIFNDLINYDLTFFYLFYKDRIGAIFQVDSATYRLYQYRTNVADSRNIGVECLVELDLLKLFNKNEKDARWTWFNNFSLIDARYIDSKEEAINNRMVELVPVFSLKTGMEFKKKNISASIQYSFMAMQYTDATNAIYTASSVSGIIPSYQILDIGVGYEYKKLSLEAGLNNALNEIYFTRRASSYPGPGIIPSDPRNFYLTLGIKL